MLRRLGGALYTRRWIVLMLSLALAIAAGVYGSSVGKYLSSDSSGGQDTISQQADNILNNQLSTSRVDVIVMFQSATLHVSDPNYQAAVTQALAPLQNDAAIANITTFYATNNAGLVSRDQYETFATVRFNNLTDKTAAYNQLRAQVHSSTLHVSLGGAVAFNKQFADQTDADLTRMEEISFPAVLIALIFVFGGLASAFLPLVVGGVAIVGALSLLRMLAGTITISTYAVNIVTLLGLGLAIDYALFIITRFREELAPDEHDVRGALQRTVATAGRTVLFSGLTVSLSLLSLVIFPLATLRSLGIGSICAVLMAMLAALIILPAILAVMGKRINALSVTRLLPKPHTVSSETPLKPQPRRNTRFVMAQQRRAAGHDANGETSEGAWYRLSQSVMRFPIPIIIGVGALLILLGTPILQVQFAAPDGRALPPTKSARYVFDRLNADFPQQSGSQQVIAVLTPGAATDPANVAKLTAYVSAIRAVAHVADVTSIVPTTGAQPQSTAELSALAAQLANGNATQIIVTVNTTDNSAQAQQAVRDLRAIAPPSGFTAYVGGTTAAQLDLFGIIGSHLWQALAVVILSTLVLLFLMTGSIVVPLKAIVLNVLSLSATFGAIVFIFQQGHFQQQLGFTPLGSVDPSQLVIVFAIAFGLSMDYEVFLISRIKEQYDHSKDNRYAVASGLQRTGRLITSAALLLAVVLLATSTSEIIFVKEIGLGLAIAVLMDASLVRTLLVPATMRLLGSANWWPNLQVINEGEALAPTAVPAPALPAE